MHRTTHWTTALVATAVMLSGGADIAAIGPTVVMFYGAPLKTPIFVTGADTNVLGDVHTSAGAAGEGLGGRPFVSVALFWGPVSDPALRGIRDLTKLTPEMAWQHGRLYPPQPGKPAVLLTTAFSKGAQRPPTSAREFVNGGVVSSDALAMLRRVGILGGN